jgi:hypothetical protein
MKQAQGYYCEIYGNWTFNLLGKGLMLIHISQNRKVEYVAWRQEGGYKKEIINQKLFDEYWQDQA